MRQDSTRAHTLRSLVKRIPLAERARAEFRYLLRKHIFPLYAPYSPGVHKELCRRFDPVRDHAIAMALATIEREDIGGDLAEVGVFRGETSELIHKLVPDRTLYLFDSFEGFPEDLAMEGDKRFIETSEEFVRSRLGPSERVVIRKGFFPDTAKGLEDKEFAFVMLDADLYETTLAGLEFFYPRSPSGGYIFAHDFNNPESDHGVSRAVQEFLAARPEHVIEIPDVYGSVVFRKM